MHFPWFFPSFLAMISQFSHQRYPKKSQGHWPTKPSNCAIDGAESHIPAAVHLGGEDFSTHLHDIVPSLRKKNAAEAKQLRLFQVGKTWETCKEFIGFFSMKCHKTHAKNDELSTTFRETPEQKLPLRTKNMTLRDSSLFQETLVTWRLPVWTGIHELLQLPKVKKEMTRPKSAVWMTRFVY